MVRVHVDKFKTAARARIFVVLFSAMALALGACSSSQDGSSSVGSPVASGPSASGSQMAPSPGSTAASDAEIARAKLRPCPKSEPNAPEVKNGLPRITLECLGEGPAVDLSGLRGRPQVINVWASWCGPCEAEIPMLAAVARQAKGKVDFLGLDVSDTRTSALDMAGRYDMGFPSVSDPTFETRGPMRIAGVPTTLFVNAQGSILSRLNGPITSEQQLRELIKDQLGVDLT